ncbi:MAG: hypothetical protein AAF975_06250, partial [Spirochaetota bacterium]
MSKKQKQHQILEQAFEKMDSEIAENVLRSNLQGNEEEKSQERRPLNFHSTDPREEGYLFHFLRQLAKLCHFRGDMIPQAQESLLKKFFLNHRDRHHLQQMSHAHALRSEEALSQNNPKLALLERLEAWRKMPRDLSLLLDVAEAYIEPERFTENYQLGAAAEKGTENETETSPPAAKAEEEAGATEQKKKNAWLGFRGSGGIEHLKK